MNVHTLSRQERRALSARGAKLYGIGGDHAVALFQAYQCLRAGDLAEACRLVLPLTKEVPDNPHSWIVLGLAALNRREGQTAKAFFGKAAESAPKSLDVITGLAKAHFLCAEPDAAVQRMEEAFGAGNTEVDLMHLYLSLMDMYGRIPTAAALLEPISDRVKNVALAREIGGRLAELEFHKDAAAWFGRAHRYGPTTEEGRICEALSLFQLGRMPEAEVLCRELLADDLAERDTVVITLIGALRFQSKNEEMLSYSEAYEFSSPLLYGRARGFAANALHDLGRTNEARHAYVEAMHVSEGMERIARGYGAFCLGLRDYATGVPNYLKRLNDKYRRLVPLENASTENLQSQTRIYVMSEQGVGDQLALLTLVRILPEADGREIVYVTDAREAELLKNNDLGVSVITKEAPNTLVSTASRAQFVALGDLVRFLPDHPPEARQGAFLRPDPEAVACVRERYAALAGDRPIYGMAWAARALIGTLRSVPLTEMVQLLPENAFVVSLQYGDTEAEIAAAQEVRPDVVFHSDPEVDQMADLAAFAAQCAALDRIVTIDNTTAHVCGALGHADTHVLLPKGVECMWYWGAEALVDPWYGVLKLHRQATSGDWSGSFASARAALAV